MITRSLQKRLGPEAIGQALDVSADIVKQAGGIDADRQEAFVNQAIHYAFSDTYSKARRGIEAGLQPSQEDREAKPRQL